MVRELVLMELPPAPLCRDGLRRHLPQCGADRNAAPAAATAESVDPRWAGLDALRDQPRGER